MKNIFKLEDFYAGDGFALEPSDCAAMANAKIQSLIDAAPTVYGKRNQWDITDGTQDSLTGCTHKAKLMFVEELKREPCKHQPIGDDWTMKNGLWLGTCEYCGVKLEARWEEVK